MNITRLPFEDVFSDESGGNIKTPQSEYQREGRFPVVDQGKALIAGYVNDKERVCGGGKPAIVFGDHTRCVKYVGHPFCIGADGVKVLRPKIDADLKYLYYYLKQIQLPNAGYDRHFKYLKRTEVVLVPLAEQRRIADILDKADSLRAKRREALAQLDRLAQSIFFEMFGDPIENSKRYPVKPLVELIDPHRPITYGILMPGPDEAAGVKYVRVVDMRNGGINLSEIKRTTPEISAAYKRSILKQDDLLMSIRGHVGRLATIPAELEGANITQDSARLAIVGASPIFVRECLRSAGFQRWMAKHTKGVAVRGINLGDVKSMPTPVPPQQVQDEFAERVRAIERLQGHSAAALAEADALFAALQYQAFHGSL